MSFIFSVLVAHYNNFEYFKQCYKSLQQQTCKDFEIIVVDDFSTDQSFEQLEKLAVTDSRLKIYRNERNEGVGFTKRRCIGLATGEICGFADPDDKLAPNAIEESLKAYNDEAVATYSQLWLCDEKLMNLKIFPHTKRISNNDNLFFNINFEVAHFFTFRKAAYQETCGIEKHYKVAEDQDLILKLYEQGSFVYIKKPLYYYRVHSEGLSHQNEKAKIKQENWHEVLLSTLKRRNIIRLYGKEVSHIKDLPSFIYKKQNPLAKRILRKLKLD